jgi:hypothetical protein
MGLTDTTPSQMGPASAPISVISGIESGVYIGTGPGPRVVDGCDPWPDGTCWHFL